MLELDDTKIYEVKEYKEKRNLDQNAKYWKLLNELALTLKISVEELHFKMLKDYSQRYEILVPKDTKLRGKIVAIFFNCYSNSSIVIK